MGSGDSGLFLNQAEIWTDKFIWLGVMLFGQLLVDSKWLNIDWLVWEEERMRRLSTLLQVYHNIIIPSDLIRRLGGPPVAGTEIYMYSMISDSILQRRWKNVWITQVWVLEALELPDSLAPELPEPINHELKTSPNLPSTLRLSSTQIPCYKWADLDRDAPQSVHELISLTITPPYRVLSTITTSS